MTIEQWERARVARINELLIDQSLPYRSPGGGRKPGETAKRIAELIDVLEDELPRTLIIPESIHGPARPRGRPRKPCPHPEEMRVTRSNRRKNGKTYYSSVCVGCRAIKNRAAYHAKHKNAPTRRKRVNA